MPITDQRLLREAREKLKVGLPVEVAVRKVFLAHPRGASPKRFSQICQMLIDSRRVTEPPEVWTKITPRYWWQD